MAVGKKMALNSGGNALSLAAEKPGDARKG
jgi:hypothetical protein